MGSLAPLERTGRRLLGRFLVVLLLLDGFFVPLAPMASAVTTNGAPAVDLIGQYDSNDLSVQTPKFTKNEQDNGPSRTGFYYIPNGETVDTTGHRLFLADAINNRVLVYNLNTDNTLPDVVPDNVLGQPDFNGGDVAATQSGMYSPYGLAFDNAGNRLFVADGFNHRVLVFNLSGGISNGMNAAFVLGQPNFTTATENTPNVGNGCTTTPNACGIKYPGGLAFDAVNNRLFVTDDNNRVLIFNVSSITNGQAAANVLGQPNFTTGGADTQNAGNGCTTTPNACGFSGMFAVAYDSTGTRLFVTDSNRVVVFNVSSITNGQAAANVLGQPNFTTGTSDTQNAGNGCTTTPNACGLNGPGGVAYDGVGHRLFVSETANNRALVFNVTTITNGQAAANVLGQPDFATSTYDTLIPGNGCTTTIANACGLDFPRMSFYDVSTSTFYVADLGNNRFLGYNAVSISNGEAAVIVVGQTDADFPTSAVPIFTKGGANDSPNKLGINPTYNGMVMDTVHHRLFMTDDLNNRVLVFNLNTNNTFPDKIPDFILGQPNFNTNTADTQNAGNGCTTAINACGMEEPQGVAYDSAGDRLFVSDRRNYRILVFSVSSITNGEAAVNVLGQPNFVTGTTNTQNAGNGCTTTPNACGFNPAQGLLYDGGTNRLFVTDFNNSRVLIFGVASIVNGQAAANVLGQPNFTTGGTNTQNAGNGCTTTINACGMVNALLGLGLDTVGNRLFVNDFGNNRVLVFNVAIITNGQAAASVIGQPNFSTGGTNTQNAGNGCTTTPNACGLNSPRGIAYDTTGNRLFVSEQTNNRVLVFNVAIITNGQAAASVIGQPNFSTATADTQNAGNGCTTTPNACGLDAPQNLMYDPGNDRLFVGDTFNYRVMIFDPSQSSGLNVATTQNKVTLSRLKAGATGTVSIAFTLTHTLSGTLTVTFPAGFTVNSAATGGSACLSNFGFTSLTLTATKTNCSGPISLMGASLTNPGSTGTYTINWVNDDPGSASIIIVSDDQISVTADVDPTITLNAGSQASIVTCDGTFTGNGGTVALGVLATGTVKSSDAASVPHICTRMTTNAASGAVLIVRSANSGLRSTSTPADIIPSSTATLVAGTAGYGICIGSAGADTGRDASTPAGATPARSAPFNGASCTSAGHDVGAVTTGSQNIWTITSASQNAFARIYVKAAISPTTQAHNDYTDTLTFVGTATF